MAHGRDGESSRLQIHTTRTYPMVTWPLP